MTHCHGRQRLPLLVLALVFGLGLASQDHLGPFGIRPAAAEAGTDAVGGFGSAGGGGGGEPGGGIDFEANRIARGLAIAPVRLDLRGKSRALVGLGSYLVNAAGGCNDCHTNPPFAAGGDPFLGEPKRINAAAYLAGGTPFGPGLFSTNLTPERATGLPGGMTLAQFFAALRSGADPGVPGRLLQVMPWPVYQNLTWHDIRAIYEYLRAIPPIGTTP